MAKWVADAVLDGALQVIWGADRMLALNGQPVDFQSAWSTRLADAAMVAADFSVADGDVSGRKIDVAAKAGVAVATSGSADHVALVDTASSRLLYVTTCQATALAAGGSVNFDGWSVEIGAPF